MCKKLLALWGALYFIRPGYHPIPTQFHLFIDCYTTSVSDVLLLYAQKPRVEDPSFIKSRKTLICRRSTPSHLCKCFNFDGTHLSNFSKYCWECPSSYLTVKYQVCIPDIRSTFAYWRFKHFLSKCLLHFVIAKFQHGRVRKKTFRTAMLKFCLLCSMVWPPWEIY